MATGIALATHFDQWGDGTLHVKLVLVALVAALVAWHIRRPAVRSLKGVIFLVSQAVVWLGVALAH